MKEGILYHYCRYSMKLTIHFRTGSAEIPFVPFNYGSTFQPNRSKSKGTYTRHR